jgi:basic membrane protein A
MLYQPGDLVLGKYRVDRFIGKGASAEVYLATHLELKAPRALKVLSRELPGVGTTAFGDYRQRFQLEAQLGARIDHPNVIRVHDFHQDEDTLILVMEFAAGGSLADRIAKARQTGQSVPVEEAVRIAGEVAQGLAALHALDCVHRDLKPSNILLDGQGRAKVADLGLAQIPGGPSQRSVLSQPLAHPGTPAYMSPEQRVTNDHLTPASDSYALGCVLFEMLTGRLLRSAKPGTRASSLRPDVPPWLDDLLGRMVDRDSEKRPWDGGEVAGLLREGTLAQAAEEARLDAERQVQAQAPEQSRLAEEERGRLAAEEQARLEAAKAGEEARLGQEAAERHQREVAERERLAREERARLVAGEQQSLRLKRAAAAAGLVALLFLAARLAPSVPTPNATPSAISTAPIASATAPAPAAPTPSRPAASLTATPSPSAEGARPLVIRLVTDIGGIDDKSFNTTAYWGVKNAVTKLGVDGAYLQSKQQTDYEKNIQEFVNAKADLIVTVGFLLGPATAKLALANPTSKFAIVDYNFPDCYPGAVVGKDCGSDKTVPNVLGIIFQTDQAAFQAGYLAAAMSRTKKVGTFGGLQIPTVTIFMTGFQAGVEYWNAQKKDTVKVLGWDTKAAKGLFTGTFTEPDKGKTAAKSLIDEGADVIMPVAGLTGNGAFTAAQEAQNVLAIGVDTDQCQSVVDACPVLLTSVRKNMDMAVYNAIKAVNDGTFKGGVNYVGTLANDGVSIAPFHDLDSKVPATLKTELDQIKSDLVKGKIKTGFAAVQ